MHRLQPIVRMMAMAHADAVRAERGRDLEVMDGVADEEGLRRVRIESLEQRPPRIDLAGGVPVRAPDDHLEMLVYSKVAERVVERGLLLRRQDRLCHAALRQALEDPACELLARALDDARIVFLAIDRREPVH